MPGRWWRCIAGNLDGSLALVNEAIAMTDADLGPDEQLLHRSVLLYNRAQILAAQGDFEGSLRDYDEVIRRDPDYGDYYFERAACRRKAGRYEEALADYATCVRLSPPFYEVHFNRADLLRELGDDEGALRDLDHALLLEPSHVDSLVNRADLLLALGELDRAGADIAEGLALDPKQPAPAVRAGRPARRVRRPGGCLRQLHGRTDRGSEHGPGLGEPCRAGLHGRPLC